MKTTGVIVIALAMLIALTGMVMADQVVPQVPEVQGFSSTTSVSAVGTVTETDAVAWALTNYDALATRTDGDGPMLDEGDGEDGQVQYSTAYDYSYQGIGGQTTTLLTRATSTGNKILSQSNLNMKSDVQFLPATEGALAIGSENIMIDGSGQSTMASDRMLCPFGADQNDVIPQYCNIVQMGSAYQLNIGSVVSSANNRFVGTDATLPVVQNYAINVKGIILSDGTTTPALGSASAYIKAAIKEGRDAEEENDGLAETLTLSETTTASGTINSFNVAKAYQSGKVNLP